MTLLSVNQTLLKLEFKVPLESEPKKQIGNKSNFYLKMAQQKKAEEDRALALTVEKCKKELEFDCLHKMSEAWEIAKLLNIPVSFVAMKGSDNSMTINFIQYIDDDDEGEGDEKLKTKKELKDEITIEEFMREYRKLKRLQNSIKNNSVTKNQKEIISSYSLNRINKAQRQEELKNVLKETMSLTTKLKDQLKILEKNGVCGSNIK